MGKYLDIQEKDDKHKVKEDDKQSPVVDKKDEINDNEIL